MSRLWDKQDIQLVTSRYALTEVERNIQRKKPDAAERLFTLMSKVEVSLEIMVLSQSYGLSEKDRPILEAAAGSDCQVLLTGDVTHFGHLIGVEAEGVRVMTISMFLEEQPA